jgi:hypothetical protein
MSKTIIAVEHDSPTFFENGSQAYLTGDVRVHAHEIPDAENAQLVGPELGFGCRPAVGERWDSTWTTILDADMR